MDFQGILPKLAFPIQQTTSMELLSHARKINSDLGAHVKSCSFSSNLAGRFYQNNSMEMHSSKLDRFLRMKEKRKRLEWELQLEEEKLKFLQQKLRDREERTQQAIDRHVEKQEQCALKIQCKIRRVLAVSKLVSLKRDLKTINFIALFIQAIFRGRKSRFSTNELRKQIIRHRKEQLATINIQCFFRKISALLELKKRKHQQSAKLNASAIIIQSALRCFVSRIKVEREKERQKSRSAVRIQIFWRKTLASIEADRTKKSRKRPGSSKSTKSSDGRIPLHERRYSSYSIQAQANAVTKLKNLRERRFSECTKGNLNIQERRSSLSGIDILYKSDNESKPLQPTNDTSQHVTKKVSGPQSPSSPKNPQIDRIKAARLKAAARVARLAKKNREEKEKQKLMTKAAKERVLELDLKRKDLLKAELCKRKKVETDEALYEQGLFMNLELDCRGGIGEETEHIIQNSSPEKEIIHDTKNDEKIFLDDNVSNHESENEVHSNPLMEDTSCSNENEVQPVSVDSETLEKHGDTTYSYFEEDFDEDFQENEDDLFDEDISENEDDLL